MQKQSTVNKKILLPLILALVVLVALVLFALKGCQPETNIELTLNQRDVALEVGQTVQLSVLRKDAALTGADISWSSSNTSVATVDDTGNVTAIAGGEAKITAVVALDGKTYSLSCTITVKSEELQYSTYKIRWYTQKKDRSGYEVEEQTFERLIGSEVALTEAEALAKVPENYTFNKDKSVLSGTVTDRQGACVLEVYYDVAEVTYSVDFYYESDSKLGTYPTKKTMEYKAYAFTAVEVTDEPQEGFVIKADASQMKCDSLVEGTALLVYCDRIRSVVSISYVSGKESVNCTAVYGVGLVDLPEGALSDAYEPFRVASYVNGEKKELTDSFLKSLVADTKIQYKVDATGFTYEAGKLVNTCGTRNTDSYVNFVGSGKTVYLAAEYALTGSKSNMFGITLESGGTSRQIRFQYQGVGVMKDHTANAGTLLENNAVYGYNTAGAGGNTYIWAQNTAGLNGMEKDSVIQKMLANRNASTHEIIWAVYEGVLYCNVDGETAVRLPLNLLDKGWTADKEYSIGVSAFDGTGTDDELTVSNIRLAFNEEAEKKLVLDDQVNASEIKRMDYDVITGSYMASSSAGAAYLYGDVTAGNSGIAADIQLVDKDNSNSAVGVTLKVGDKSHQYVIEGMNSQIRHQQDHGWNNITWVTAQVTKLVTPVDKDGETEVQAFVKDGYFYIFYNGVQAHCVNMLALFPEYTDKTEASVGLYSWDASNGLARFRNIELLDKAAVDAVKTEQWGFYSEDMVRLSDYDFAEGTIIRVNNDWKKAALLGTAKAWQVSGTMNVTASANAENIPMGFRVESGDKSLIVLGSYRGITYQTHADEVFKFDNQGTSVYAFNDKNQAFFGSHTAKRSVAFETLVYEDVLYVWYDGEICWRLPLTDEKFGGFEEGASYKLSLYFGAVDGKNDAELEAEGSMTDLTVQMGPQVEADETLLAAINKNLSVWNDMSVMHVTGSMAQTLESVEIVGGKNYAYFNGSADQIYLSADCVLTPSAAAGFEGKTFNFGISLRQGEVSRQVFFGLNGNLSVMQNHTGTYTLYTPGRYVWVQNTTNNNLIDKLVSGGESCHVEWIVVEDMLYGRLDGFVFVKLPLSEVFGDDYVADSDYEVGFARWNAEKAGDVDFNDIELIFGEAVGEKLASDAKIEDAELHHMEYEGVGGSYRPNSIMNPTYLYGGKNVGKQAVSAVVTMLDPQNTRSSSGITLRNFRTGESVQILASADGKVRMQFGHDMTYSVDLTDYVQNDAVAYENGICELTAVVKDGKLYVLYNGVQAGSIPVSLVLPGSEESDELQLGVTTIDADKGLVDYFDITFVSGDDVDDIETDDTTFGDFKFLTGSVINADVDHLAGNVKPVTAGQGVNATFLQSEKIWQVGGTMQVGATAESAALPMGFKIVSGDKSLLIMGSYRGFMYQIAGGELQYHNQGNTVYAFNDVTQSFFGASTAQRSVAFRAVIYQDILYVFFNGEICWRVPLTDAKFGGFAAGSEYKVGIHMGGGTPAGEFKDLMVLNNEDVTGQNGFADTIAAIDSNLNRWNSFQYLHLTGALAENVTAIEPNASASFAYLAGAHQDVMLSAKYHTTPSTASGHEGTTFNFGLTIRTGDVSRQILFRKDGKIGVFVNHQFTNAEFAPGQYVIVQSTANNAIQKMVHDVAGGTYQIDWIIADEILFGRLEGEIFLQMPLEVVFGSSYQAGASYEMGFARWNSTVTGDVSYTDISVTTGSAVEGLLQDKKLDGVDIRNFRYNPLTGAYQPYSAGGSAYIYNAAATGNTGISANVAWADKDNTTSAVGVTVKIGSESHQYVIQGMNTSLRHHVGHDWGTPTWVSAQVKDGLGILPFNNEGVMQVQAFVKDGYFYILYNGQQAHCINMLSLFPTYTAEKAVSVGVYSWDANLGLADFGDITLMDAASVNSVTTGQWGAYSEDMVNLDGFDPATGTISKTNDRWERFTLLGAAKTWQVTGNMYRAASSTATIIPMGFKITSGSTELTVTGYNRGFNGTDADKAGTSVYAFNDATYDANNIGFFGSHTAERSIAFKAAIYDDVFYVWYNGEICWRIPLTEKGFAAGSEYKLSLMFAPAESINAAANMSGLQVLMDNQVTAQNGFAALCDAIDANVTKWSNSFTRMHLVGEKGELLTNSFYETGAVPTNGTAAFLNGSGSTVYMIADYAKATDATFNFGITIRKGTEVRRVTLRKDGKIGIYTNLNDNALVEKTAGNGIYLSAAANTIITTGGTHTIKWVITDGVLYAWYQDALLLYIPMNQVHSGWTDVSAQYEVGVGQFNPGGAGTVVYSASALYGDDATNAVLINYNGSSLTVEEATDKVIFWKELKSMKATGTFAENLVLVDDISIYTDYAFAGAADSTQYLSYDATVAAGAYNYGVIVRNGNMAVRVVIGSGGAEIGVYPNDKFDGRVAYTPGAYVWVADASNNALTKMTQAGTHHMEWMIVDGTLYARANGTMIMAIPLNKLNSGWTADGSYELGIANCNHEGVGKAVNYSNIDFVSGAAILQKQLSDGKTVSEAIQVIRWSEVSKMTVSGETANRVAISSATTESHYAYLNGSASNLYLSAKYTLTPSTNATHAGTTFNFGIVIRSGGVVRPVMFRKGNVYLGYLSSYAWSDPVVLTSYVSNGDKINAMLSNANGGTYELNWLILDGSLYAYLNDDLILSVNLSVLNADWDASDSYEMGVFQYNPSAAGKADIMVEQHIVGSEVQSGLAPKFSAAYFNGQIAVDPLNGMLIQKAPANGSVSSRFFLNGSSTQWEITGSMINNGTTGTKRGGFLITTSDRPMNNWSNNNDYMFLLTAGCGFKMVTQKNANAWFSEQSNVGDFLKADATSVMSDFTSAGPGTIYFKAVIQNDVLYTWFGSAANDLKPGWKMPLTSANNATYSVFAQGSSYRLGFAGTETNKPDFQITSVSTTVTTDVSSFG